jgi:hypothetical protein
MRLAALFFPLLLLAGCASEACPPPLPVTMPLPEALDVLGTAREIPGATPLPEIVLQRDRHAVGPGIFYVDEDLRAFQRDQHRTVSHLVARGFTLLGCEHTLGPLPRNAAAEDHIAVMERAKADGDDLNRWSVFQPLRYEIEFAGRLTVIGVEDPALYQQDLDTLAQLEKVARVAKEGGSAGPGPKALAAEEARLLRNIRANVVARGEAAARNLLAVMQERGVDRAILMVGGSHIPAASAELSRASVHHWVFEAPTFRRKAE